MNPPIDLHNQSFTPAIEIRDEYPLSTLLLHYQWMLSKKFNPIKLTVSHQ